VNQVVLARKRDLLLQELVGLERKELAFHLQDFPQPVNNKKKIKILNTIGEN